MLKLYFYSWQIHFNMGQTIYPFLQKRRTSASVLDSGHGCDILCGSLVPCCKQLQGFFWVLPQIWNMSLSPGWSGEYFLSGCPEQHKSPSLSSFYSSTDSYYTRYSPTFPSRCILRSWTPAHNLQPWQPKWEILHPSISGPSPSVESQIHYEPIISKRLQMCSLTRVRMNGRINLT